MSAPKKRDRGGLMGRLVVIGAAVTATSAIVAEMDKIGAIIRPWFRPEESGISRVGQLETLVSEVESDAQKRDSRLDALETGARDRDRRLTRLEDGWALVVTIDERTGRIHDRLIRMETLCEAGIICPTPSRPRDSR